MKQIIYYWNKFLIKFFIKNITYECLEINNIYYDNLKLFNLNQKSKKYKMSKHIYYR